MCWGETAFRVAASAAFTPEWLSLPVASITGNTAQHAWQCCDLALTSLRQCAAVLYMPAVHTHMLCPLSAGSFRGRSADFLCMLLFGGTLLTVLAPFVQIEFLGSSLTFMMVYVWGRRHQYVNLSFLGIFNFTAPYLPWVLLAFSVMLGSSPKVDLLGMVAGELGSIASLERTRGENGTGVAMVAEVSLLAPPQAEQLSMASCQDARAWLRLRAR